MTYLTGKCLWWLFLFALVLRPVSCEDTTTMLMNDSNITECASIFTNLIFDNKEKAFRLKNTRGTQSFHASITSNHKTGTVLINCLCGKDSPGKKYFNCSKGSTTTDGTDFNKLGRRIVNMVRGAYNTTVSGYFYHQHPTGGDIGWTHSIMDISDEFMNSHSINKYPHIAFRGYNEFVQCMALDWPLFHNQSYISALETFPLDAGLVLETFRTSKILKNILRSGKACQYLEHARMFSANISLKGLTSCVNLDLDDITTNLTKAWFEVLAPAFGRPDVPLDSIDEVLTKCTKNDNNKRHFGNHSSPERIQAGSRLKQLDKELLNSTLSKIDMLMDRDLDILYSDWLHPLTEHKMH